MYKILIIFFLFTSAAYAQIASDFFPASTGYKWFFKNTPLDSLNNPLSSQATFQIDSFAANVNYKGLPANMVLSKSGLTNINQNAPFSDTSYFNFQSSNAWYYLNVLSLIGSIPIIDSIAFIAFLRSFEAWYNTYRFAQTINLNYTILSRDTTITIDTLTLPLRLSAIGKRLNDENVSTVNGTFLAKKFVLNYAISYLLTIPPFPTVVIPIVTRPDTVYFSTGIWKIKEVIPSVNVDLSAFGVPFTFYLPGVLTELTSPTIGINSQSENSPEQFLLFQNYPNPFNPSTIIKYYLNEYSNVKLSVYDINGREIEVLIDQFQYAGNYTFKFDANNLSNGIYFYKLKNDYFSEIKKMILLK